MVALIAILLVTAGYAISRSPEQATTRATVPQEYVHTAIFAGGCFWCMESAFEKVPGVIEVKSGYTGGSTENPTYEEVSHTRTGHVEAVRIWYDSRRLTYSHLLQVFWRNIDPTDNGGQFADRGDSYLAAIFVGDEEQRLAAESSKQLLVNSNRFDKPIVTPIRKAAPFYLAEEYHQNYYKKHPLQYRLYRYSSGRDRFIESVWGEGRHD